MLSQEPKIPLFIATKSKFVEAFKFDSLFEEFACYAIGTFAAGHTMAGFKKSDCKSRCAT